MPNYLQSLPDRHELPLLEGTTLDHLPLKRGYYPRREHQCATIKDSGANCPKVECPESHRAAEVPALH